MALKEAFMEKLVEGGTSLTLSPNQGEAIRVKDIQIVSAQTVSGFATVRVGRKDICYLRCAPVARSHMGLNRVGSENIGLMAFLAALGHNTTIPVAEQETLEVSVAAAWTWAKVLYEVYDAPDVSPTEPNGSKSDDLIYVAYGTNKAAITSTDYATIDKILNPVGFPAFPFEATVPAGFTLTLLGILFAEVEENFYPGAADKYIRTAHLRLMRGLTFLFDEDRVGFRVLGDGAAAGSKNIVYLGGESEIPYHGETTIGRFWPLPEPIVFGPGEELNVQVDYTLDATAQLDADTLDIALVFHAVPV